MRSAECGMGEKESEVRSAESGVESWESGAFRSLCPSAPLPLCPFRNESIARRPKTLAGLTCQGSCSGPIMESVLLVLGSAILGAVRRLSGFPGIIPSVQQIIPGTPGTVHWTE